MAARPRLSLLIGLVLVSVGAACSDNGPAPTGPTAPSVKAPSGEVSASGIVRDERGMPLAGATVTASSGLPRIQPSTETGQDGRFSLQIPLPASPEGIGLHARADGLLAPAWSTTYVPGQEITAEIRMQRRLSVSVGESLSSVLQTDDPAWNPFNGPRCAPCQQVFIGHSPNTALPARVVSVTWRGAAAPSLWMTGIDAGYDYSFTATGERVSAEQRIEATIPATFSATAYVGLLTGSIVEPVPYEISVDWAPLTNSTRGDR